MKLNKKILGLIGAVVFGIIIIAIVFIKYPFTDVISTFTNFTPLLVLLYLIVSVCIMVSLTYRWKVILNALGYKIPLFKLVGYRIIGYGVSYLTPSAKVGGEPLRAALLKRQGMSFKQGLSSIILDKTLELSASAVFFLIGAVILVLAYALPARFIAILIIASLIIIYLVWSFYSRILKGKTVFANLFKFLRLHKLNFLAKYHKKIYDFEKPMIDFYKSKRKAFIIASIISLFSLGLSVIEYKLVLLMLGINASPAIAFIILSVTGIAFMIPLPMALGSLEAFQASIFSLLRIGPAASGVGVAMITRSRDLLWVLGAFILSFYIGSVKSIINKAYKDKPVVGVVLSRRDGKHSIDIKIRP